MNDDINHIPSNTPDFQTELAERLAELAPEAIADGKIDVEKLKELLDGDADESNERFGLLWPGKKRALRAAQQPTTATLKPDLENSKDWDTTKNVFIEGDNLEVLKILQKHYHGKIKMIYIDPPYNTGKDFVYPDNFKEGLGTYLEWTKQVNEQGQKLSTNSESEGRYHSNWLNMMYPRLKLARNLLTDDGVIFISIDQHEHGNLLRLCSEIFGESNVLGAVAVVNNLKGRSDDEYFATANEFFIACARNSECAEIFGFTPGADYQAEFKHKDEISNYKEVGLQKTGKNSRRIDRPNMYYPIYFVPDTSSFSLEKVDGALEIYPTPINGVDGRWRWGKETFLKNKDTELTARNVKGIWRIYVKMRDIVNGRPRTVRPKTVWSDPRYDTAGGSRNVKDLFQGKNPFDNPKPVAFLRDLITVGTKEDSVVLDFFAGSGTTGQAVLEHNAADGGNRRHIQVQLPEPTPEGSSARQDGFGTIAELSRERIRRAGEKIRQDFSKQLSKRKAQLDVGFRAYKLSDTNFSKWQVSSDTPVNELEQHLLELRESANDNATPADLFVELLLKQGYSLTEDIGDISIAGLDLKTVLDADGDVAVLAYLNEHSKPTLDQLREIADSKPVRFVILEDCFQGDDELKTNLVQICKTNGIELWTA